MDKERIVIGSAIGFAAGVGVAVGYFIAFKKLEAEYEELALKEIEEAKQFYGALYKKEEYETPESAAEHLLSPEAEEELKEAAVALQRYAGMAVAEIPKETKIIEEATLQSVSLDTDGMGRVEVVHNVFTDARLTTDEDEGEAEEDDTKPYIVSQADYMEGGKGFEQVTLTYFEGDDVLVDSRDEAVDDVDRMVGSDNLLRFGFLSKDPNVLYIRNVPFSLDIEVLRSKGKFSEEVLGFIQHSDSRGKIRKFRGDYE